MAGKKIERICERAMVGPILPGNVAVAAHQIYTSYRNCEQSINFMTVGHDQALDETIGRAGNAGAGAVAEAAGA